MRKGFQQGNGGTAGETTYSWSVPEVTSPDSLRETDTFKIYIYDQYAHLIDEVTSGVTV